MSDLSTGFEPQCELLKGYRTITTIPVQWGDQDAFGHVNNVIYFRWFESARIDLLQALPSSVTMSGTGLGPILASIKCDYRKQLHFPDLVDVGSRVTRIGRSSVDIGHAIVSRQQNQIVAEGTSVVVVFDYALGRVTRIPDDLRQKFEESMSTELRD
jgi:acyl-CoA thioester hydrolase